MKIEVPKRHISRSTLSTSMVQRVLWWERQHMCSSRKRQRPMAKKCCYNKIWMKYFFLGRRGWRQEKTREWSNLILFPFKTAFFWHILKKISTFTFGAWSFLLVHLWFTPSEEPKGFVKLIFFIKIKPWKSDHGERPSSMVQVHGPWCKLALRGTSHTSQEPWPWNCESPNESVQGASQDTSKIMLCGHIPSSVVRSHLRPGTQPNIITIHACPHTW